MFEVADTGEYHRDTVLVAIVDRQVVAYRTAGLNHRIDTLFVSDFHAIGEGEESICGPAE